MAAMTTIHPRTAWVTTLPVTGPAADLRSVKYIVVHYGAVPWNEARLRNSPQYIRDTHAYYVNSRGYSVGYNFFVGRDGSLWEARGFDIRNAANGRLSTNSPLFSELSPQANNRTISIHVILPLDGSYEPVQLDGVRNLVSIIRARCGAELPIVPHSDIVETSCPTDLWRRMIAGGDLEPRSPQPDPPVPPIPPEQFPMFDDVVCYSTCPASSNPAMYAQLRNNTKVWLHSQNVWAAHKRLAKERGFTFRVESFSVDEFRALGPVVGPRPRRTDEWGV
jgi:hypothetical protein